MPEQTKSAKSATHDTKPNFPECFRDVIAIIDFNDIGPTKALGYFCISEDSKELCFVVHAGRTAYIADLITAWKYLEDEPHSYTVVRKEPDNAVGK